MYFVSAANVAASSCAIPENPDDVELYVHPIFWPSGAIPPKSLEEGFQIPMVPVAPSENAPQPGTPKPQSSSSYFGSSNSALTIAISPGGSGGPCALTFGSVNALSSVHVLLISAKSARFVIQSSPTRSVVSLRPAASHAAQASGYASIFIVSYLPSISSVNVMGRISGT